jgi:hypothetical protein
MWLSAERSEGEVGVGEGGDMKCQCRPGKWDIDMDGE